jgi:hypothetical protein
MFGFLATLTSIISFISQMSVNTWNRQTIRPKNTRGLSMMIEDSARNVLTDG